MSEAAAAASLGSDERSYRAGHLETLCAVCLRLQEPRGRWQSDVTSMGTARRRPRPRRRTFAGTVASPELRALARSGTLLVLGQKQHDHESRMRYQITRSAQ